MPQVIDSDTHEPELVSVIRARDDVPSRVVDKMLYENPQRFYPLG